MAQAPRPSKADQIVQNFYTKVAQIITQARLIQYDSLGSGNIPPNINLARQAPHHPKKPNKWFNLEMWDSDFCKEDLKKYWRHIAASSDPMIIEFFLDTSELPKNKILVITDEILRRRRVDVHENGDGESKNILLESWQLTLSQPLPDPPPDLPVVYKKSIAFFRSLYAYLRLLPAFRLYKRIKMKLNNALKIGYRFVLPNTDYVDDIGIDVPIIEGETSNVSSQYTFGPIDTPLGVLSLKVNYRSNCEFHIDDSAERILSSNLMDMVDFDEQFFTPTVVKYYQEQEKERRKSVPTKMNTPPSRYLLPGHSPQYNNMQLGGTPLRSLSSPRSNPDSKEYLNTELTFPKINAPPSRPSPSTLTLSNNTASLRSSDPRRSFETNPSLSRSGRHDNLSTSRPNVTLVQPFKSPVLSSSPSQPDNIPSPTFSERSSPLHRSPSSLSLQQRNIYTSSSTRLSGGATLSSSVKSNSSGGSAKFQTSFRRDGSVSSRKRSRSSLTNRSDGSTSDRSFNSSFFASLDPEDDVGEFVRLVDTREPLKMFSRSPAGSDGSGSPGSNTSSSVYKSKQLQLSRFQKNKESHNTLSDSITSITLQPSSQQLEPPSGLTFGASNGSVSSSSTMSSISKSTTRPPNVPSRLSENVTLDKPKVPTTPQPVRIPQTSSGETHAVRHRRSSSITSGDSLGKGMGLETDNGIIGNYPSYELSVGMHRSSSLPSQSKLNFNQHSRRRHNQLYNETNSESRDSMIDRNQIMVRAIKNNTEGMKSVIEDDSFNDGLITDGVTDVGDISGSPISLRVQEEELLFNISDLSEERPVNVNNNGDPAKLELGTTTESNSKMSRIDEEL